jgi:hypothetical protein
LTDEQRQRKLDEAAKRRRAELDAAITAFALSLDSLTEQWQGQIQDLLDTPYAERLAPAQLYQFLQVQIPAQLDRLGYAALIRETTRQYQESIDAVQEQLADAQLRGSLARDEESDLRTMQAVDHDKLRLLGTVAAASLVSGLVLAHITGAPKDELKPIISRPLDSLRTSAGQMVETGMYTADRFTYWQITKKIADKWLYAGIRDERNRPFCREHVGKVYTMAQLEKMDNSQSPPFNDVPRFLGGIRCRHLLVLQITA